MITLEQAKAQLNVTHDLDDGLIRDKLAAAKAFVAAYTGGPVESGDQPVFSADGTVIDDTPAAVRQATLMLTAHLYENREASLVGVTAQHLPFGFLDLLANYRAFAF